jgi:glutathione S-transferase
MLQLVIGNKNYSSWSMRPWVLMKQLGLPFEEIKLRFDFSTGSPFYTALAQYTPAGQVPVLRLEPDADGRRFAVWDTLAIAEALADAFPGAGVWPADARARARARSVCAEMHAGFSALRQHCPMNIELRAPEIGARVLAEQPQVRNNLARIQALWADALAISGGPFLFGAFSAADAFYAPVGQRILTYGLPVSAPSRAYIDRVAAAQGVAAWVADALAEGDFIAEDEPYRVSRAAAP